MRHKLTEKLIDKYEEFSKVFDDELLKAKLHSDVLQLYSEIDEPNDEEHYTIGLLHYFDYNEKTSKIDLNVKVEKAIQYFQKSLEQDSNYYMSNYYLGHCFQDLEDYEKAIQQYLKIDQKKLKEEFPLWRYVLLFELIGFCYWESGKKDIGIKYFEKTCSEYVELKDYYDLFPIGDLIERCLGDKHKLVLEMKKYHEIKSNE
ncbi:hypothetical protein [Aquimarina sp. LLG6339-5]|uniref:hypothetical protein n=1 Tax=Aquimarina sp. LLG6339-5 TaxID=3160830 RepID=UPI003864B44E